MTDFNCPLSASEASKESAIPMCAQAEPCTAADSQPSTCADDESQIPDDDEINWDNPEYRTAEFRM
jgi:hypothetical protein